MNSSVSINSVVTFAAAFLLMHFLNEFATATIAAYFGLKPIMYVHSIKYSAYDLWTPYNVKRTFLGSGIVNLITGFIFFRLFIMVKQKNTWYRIFFLWLALVGFVMFLGKILSIPFYEFKPDPAGHIAFGVVVAYKYVSESIKWMISGFSILLMMGTGLFFTYQFLRTAESKDQLKKGEFRRSYILQTIFIPYLVGTFIIGIANFPNNMRTIMIYFFVGLLMIISSMMFSSRTIKVLLYRVEPQKISKIAIGILLFLIIFYRSIYEKGIGCNGYFYFLFCCDCKG